MELLIISGMSGAGKSNALRACEDIGYFCMDNMPPALLGTFYDLCKKSTDEKMKKCAIVMDIRSVSGLSNLYKEMEEQKKLGKKFKILFLDAKTETIITRFKETRRTHPLADIVPDRSMEIAVKKEKEILDLVKAHADYIVDTTYMSPKQLRERMIGLFSTSISDAMKVTVMSFGFKYGIPLETDILFDARCLRNPYYVPELKNLTGADESVFNYVMDSNESKEFLEKIISLLDFSLPLYKKEGKSELVIAIGCTGGKHRSVTFARQIQDYFIQKGYSVNITHRDITKQ